MTDVKVSQLPDKETPESTDMMVILDGDDNQVKKSLLGALTVGGGGGATTIADGADIALGATTDAAGANTAIGQLKTIAAAAAATGSVPVTVADGDDSALGAKADAAYTTGSGSLVAILKGIFARLVKGQATSANSLSVVFASDATGAPTSIADGSDVATGAKADTAYTTGSGSVIAILKGLFARLVKGQATSANSLSVVMASDAAAQAVTLADGANVAQGAVADAAYTTGSGSVIAILKGIFARLVKGQATMANSLSVVFASDAATINVTAVGSGAQVGADITLTWAASIGTGVQQESADQVNPSAPQRDALYLITVYNPSTITGLTVTVLTKETLASSARYGELAVYGVGVNSTVSMMVQGMFVSEAMRIRMSNDSSLGAGQGFSAVARIRKV
jgi:hypothetical protein